MTTNCPKCRRRTLKTTTLIKLNKQFKFMYPINDTIVCDVCEKEVKFKWEVIFHCFSQFKHGHDGFDVCIECVLLKS